MKICHLNPTYADLSFEKELLRGTGVELASSVVDNAEEIQRAAEDADAILTVVVPVDAGLVGNLQKCRAIVRLDVGYEMVDVESCRKKGIHVCHVPDYGTEEVANHAIGLLFSVHRRILSYDRKVRNCQWGHALPWPIHRLSTLRVGVVGLGRIASSFARSIKAFVRDVVGFDPFFAADQLGVANVQKMSLESLFETSDIISLHLPLSEKPIISSLLRGSL